MTPIEKLNAAIEKSTKRVIDVYSVFSKASALNGEGPFHVVKLIDADGVIAMYTEHNIYVHAKGSDNVIVLPLDHMSIKAEIVVYP